MDPADEVVAGVPLNAAGATNAAPVADDMMLRKFRKELNSGLVSLVLLAILDRSTEPLYGYQIAKSIEGSWQEGAPVKQGTLYPVLRSMEESGLLGSRVEPSVSGPPRKYYTITDRGRSVLTDWRSAWSSTRDFVDATLEGRNGA